MANVPISDLPVASTFTRSTAIAPIVTGGVTKQVTLNQIAPMFNVKDYGAAGDGVTDDTTAFQAAITAIPTSLGGSDPGYGLLVPRGLYKLTNKLTIGNRRIAFIGEGTAALGSGSASIIYQSDETKDIIDFTTGNSDVISFEGIEFRGASVDGVGRGLVLGSSSQACFDSRITNCWFVGIPDKAIEGVNLQGTHIVNCGFDSSGATDEFGIYITKGSDNIIALNRIFGQQGSGLVILEGDNNQICDNHFDFCGLANDTSGAILLNINASGSKVARGTIIEGNNFKANQNDITLIGTGSVYLTNVGIIDTAIVGNITDRANRQFVYQTGGVQTRILNNTICTTNQAAASLNAIEITGAADQTIIQGNSVSLGSSIPFLPVYGLALGASTTNTYLGPNRFQGTTGDVNINASASVLDTSSYVQTGTWTPSIGGSATYTVQEGFYRKQGRQVFLYGKIVINAIGTGSATTISGLPFAQRNATNASQASGSVSFFQTLASNVTFLNPVVTNNASTMTFTSIGAAGGTATPSATVFQNSARIDFTVIYLAAQ